MEFSQVRAFLVLAEELHFGKAAARLHMSQPPLSRQIRMLEDEIGVALFERTSRTVSITPAGEAFRKEAREIVAKKDAAILAAINASSHPTGSLSIGFVGAATYAFLPRLAAALKERLPWLTVRFQEATSVAQLDALSLERLDIGLMRPVDGIEAFHKRTVSREPLMLAIPLSHPLAQRRRIDLSQIDGQPLVTFSDESPYLKSLLKNLFREAGIRPVVVQEFAQSQAILSLVSAGLGLAVVPGGTASASLDNVVFRPLRLDRHDGPSPSIDLIAIWNNDTENASLASVLKIIYDLSN